MAQRDEVVHVMVRNCSRARHWREGAACAVALLPTLWADTAQTGRAAGAGTRLEWPSSLVCDAEQGAVSDCRGTCGCLWPSRRVMIAHMERVRPGRGELSTVAGGRAGGASRAVHGRQVAGGVASASSAGHVTLRPPFTRVYVVPSRASDEYPVSAFEDVVSYYKDGWQDSHYDPFQARAEHVRALVWHERVWRPGKEGAVLRRAVKEARARRASRLTVGSRRGSVEERAALSGGGARRSGAGGAWRVAEPAALN